MTVSELLDRLRRAPGKSLDAQIAAVVEAVASNHEEAESFVRTLGPWALRQLDRHHLKDGGPPLPVPIGNTGLRKLGIEMRRPDILKSAAYLKAMHQTIGMTYRLLLKVAEAYLNDRETYQEARKRLDPALRQQVDRWLGLKQLNAA